MEQGTVRSGHPDAPQQNHLAAQYENPKQQRQQVGQTFPFPHDHHKAVDDEQDRHNDNQKDDQQGIDQGDKGAVLGRGIINENIETEQQ